LIVKGSQHQFYDNPTFAIAELSQLIADFCELDNNIAKVLYFCYETQVGGNKEQ
jgi:hypothetical protein